VAVVNDLVGIAFGVVFALGLLFVVAGILGVELPSAETRASWPQELQLGADQVVLRLGIGLAAGILIWVSTGWPVGTAVAFLFGAAAPSLIGAKARRAIQMARLEALAEWTEMLRSVLASAAGVEEAIRTTAAVAPSPIRPEVQRLALLLERERLVPALGVFAEEMDHAVADRIVVALQMAATRQTGRLREQLSAMARDTRMEVGRRQRVEAERASEFTLARNIVLLVAFMLVFFVVTRPEYMEPFGTALGQLMLLGVGVLLGATLFVLLRMARVVEPRRILRVAGSGRRG
jgi:hypothetical protein